MQVVRRRHVAQRNAHLSRCVNVCARSTHSVSMCHVRTCAEHAALISCSHRSRRRRVWERAHRGRNFRMDRCSLGPCIHKLLASTTSRSASNGVSAAQERCAPAGCGGAPGPCTTSGGAASGEASGQAQGVIYTGSAASIANSTTIF